VLAGPGTSSYHDPRRGIIDLGFVDEAQKSALIRKARVLAQPSVNESYSRVMMEAWREKIPVIARRSCLATATAVLRSGGGFVAESLDDWADAFLRLETVPAEEFDQLGQRGAAYAVEHADWTHVIQRFHEATDPEITRGPLHRGKRVDQIVETMAYGDAISDYARTLRARLQAQGHDGKIYARVIHPLVVDDTELLRPEPIAASAALIYHHSIAFDDLEMVLSARAPKALIYHNITPAHFFREYNPVFADQLDIGRSQLSALSGSFTACAAVSEYNAQELRELGFQNVAVVPVPVNFGRFDVTPAPVHRATGAQWLFVGRVSPNKGLRRLIEAFEIHACLDPAARLTIVGSYNPGDRYYLELLAIVREQSLEESVTFAGVVDEATLTAHYRSADLYVCMSDHEGFCVPLVEAMYFDIPIIASANTAIVETMGDAGLLVDDEAGPMEIAALAREVCTDAGLRDRIVDSQRRRRTAFDPATVFALSDAFIANLQ
jgi:glycosyltransferase involved in cell wall biosynthesis